MEKRANSVKKQHQKSPQFITSTFSVCHLPCNLPSSEVNLLKFYIFILIRLEIQQGFHAYYRLMFNQSHINKNMYIDYEAYMEDTSNMVAWSYTQFYDVTAPQVFMFMGLNIAPDKSEW